MDTTVKIDARDVNFWYGDFHALKGISMEIEEKSVVAFIGPSGCGKSGDSEKTDDGKKKTEASDGAYG